VRMPVSSSRPPAGCFTGVLMPIPAPSQPGSARVGMPRAAARYRAGKACRRAAVMSWTEPGSASESQFGNPPGRATAWTLPPWRRALPEYHRAGGLAFGEQQARHLRGQFTGHVEGGSIGDQRGVLRDEDLVVRPLLPGLHAYFPARPACPRVRPNTRSAHTPFRPHLFR
jgi:hypothetical protein